MTYEKDEVLKTDSEKWHANHTAKVIYHQNILTLLSDFFNAFKPQ